LEGREIQAGIGVFSVQVVRVGIVRVHLNRVGSEIGDDLLVVIGVNRDSHVPAGAGMVHQGRGA